MSRSLSSLSVAIVESGKTGEKINLAEFAASLD